MSRRTTPRLRRGDLPPRMLTPPPGPRARHLSRRLAEVEAPGINTLYGGEANILWREARGANVLDVDGNRYVDLTSGFGVAAIGHRHPRVTAALRRQSGRLLHGLGDAAGHEPRIELASLLARLVPIDDARTYFAVSGADAVEIAVKTALLATGRRGVLAFEPAYHGLTFGALAATSRPAFRDPFASHLQPFLHRLPFGCETRRLATALTEGSYACLLVEPIVGREGILLPPAGWLEDIVSLCRRHRVLMIADEIFTGFGRTGSLFAVDHEAVRPDLLCCGKALAGGLPIGAVLGPRSLMDAWYSPGEALHTATFVAHPLACATALAALGVILEEDLPGRAGRLGQRVEARLRSWSERFRTVSEVRGRALLWGIELISKRTVAALTQRARERGILLLAGGPDGKVAQIVPPLTIGERQLEVALDILEEVLAEMDGLS